MPYATNGRVSHELIEGGIQISDQQYADAVAGIVAGKSVSIEGGFHLVGASLPGSPPSPPTAEDIGVERDRRLGLGFDYDFKDDRGVHHLNTTAEDMKGWDVVTKLKDALFQKGDATTTIAISTATGEVSVTGPEWNDILLFAAANFEQPLWQASFVLEKMSPIPSDYATNAAYWPA